MKRNLVWDGGKSIAAARQSDPNKRHRSGSPKVIDQHSDLDAQSRVLCGMKTITYAIEQFVTDKPVQSNGTWGRGGWVTHLDRLPSRERAEELLPNYPGARIAEITYQYEVAFYFNGRTLEQ